MKTISGWLLNASLLLTLVLPASGVAAQKKDSAGVAALMAAQQYTFRAESVTPMEGRLRQLTSEYYLQVAPDKVVAQLPYFGRAYSAPLNPSGGGFDFASARFSYTAKNRKKGGWDITIKPGDAQDVQQLLLTVFDNGTASLQVLSNNRQPISFNGYLTASDKKK